MVHCKSPISRLLARELPDSNVVKADNFGEWWRKQADGIGLGAALGMLSRHVVSGLSREDLIALGEQLVRAHVPAPKYDWRARLRLPDPEARPEPDGVASAESQPSPPPELEKELPLIVSNAHGKITITRIPDGRYALK